LFVIELSEPLLVLLRHQIFGKRGVSTDFFIDRPQLFERRFVEPSPIASDLDQVVCHEKHGRRDGAAFGVDSKPQDLLYRGDTHNVSQSRQGRDVGPVSNEQISGVVNETAHQVESSGRKWPAARIFCDHVRSASPVAIAVDVVSQGRVEVQPRNPGLAPMTRRRG
jgi:hypothetical protein